MTDVETLGVILIALSLVTPLVVRLPKRERR
jgi:hypothetical protein